MVDATSSTQRQSISDFNILDPVVQDSPFEYYALLRENAPVHFAPEIGMYVISRYDDIKSILLDPETYSNNLSRVFNSEPKQAYDAVIAERGWPEVSTLHGADPPEHTRYRRIADQIFNAKRIERYIPRVEEIVATTLDRIIDRGECEFVSEFAFPVVGTITSEQLGLDAAEMSTFKRWGEAIMLPAARKLTTEEYRENAETILEMQHFVAKKLEQVRAEPKDDLMSALVQAGAEDAEPLTSGELQSLMRQFLSGSYESVVSLMSHGLWMLIRFPEQMLKLRANPSLVKDFVEETLRFETAVPGLLRRTTREVEIAGVKIPAGSTLMIRYAAGNHDDAKFPCPHMFDIERRDKAHLSFGMGTHMCIGRVLARRELITVFTALLQRMDNIQLARPLPDMPHSPHLTLRPLKELPIVFSKKA